MKFFIRSQIDAQFAVNRCYFEADHSRAALAVERLQVLEKELPGNPHLLYAEGEIRRRYLGQATQALMCFEQAWSLSRENPAKRETTWFAACNAADLAPNEERFRVWANRAIEASPVGHPDRHKLADALKKANSPDGWLALLFTKIDALQASNELGILASFLEVALATGNLTSRMQLPTHKSRATTLRALDAKDHRSRLALMEEFPPDERLALQDAVREMDLVIALDEFDAEAWNLKAAWLTFLGRNDEAISAAERAMTLRPHNYPRPYINKACALVSLGRVDHAIQCATEASRIAEAAGLLEEADQARRQINDYQNRSRSPALGDFLAWREAFMACVRRTGREELIADRASTITFDMIVDRIQNWAHTCKPFSAKTMVPIMAQLIGDFTPETAYCALERINYLFSQLAEACMQSVIYLAIKEEPLGCRDARRLLALLILAEGDDEAIRNRYRWLVLEPAAASSEFDGLIGAMELEFRRIALVATPLITCQPPVDEGGRNRAKREFLSRFDGEPPLPLHASHNHLRAKGGCIPRVLVLLVLSFLASAMCCLIL